MERGWDPDVKKYFVKVLNSVFIGLLWMIASSVAGIYFHLAYTDGKPLIYTMLFYAGMLISLFLLVRYYYRTWKK